MGGSIFLRIAAVLLAIAGISLSVQAQTMHEPSGVILPSNVDDMQIAPRKIGIYGEFARAYDFANEADRIEIYVFRATYPNASVWFPMAKRRALGLLEAGQPTPFNEPTIVATGSEAPNTIRQTYWFSKHYKSSAIATVSLGDWIVFVMTTSKVLEPAQQQARMDTILAQVASRGGPSPSPPITVIEQCAQSTMMDSYRIFDTAFISDPGVEMVTIGALGMQFANIGAIAGSPEGLVQSPNRYCMESSESGKTMLFRSKGEDPLRRWIMPMDVSGMSIEGMALPYPSETDEQATIGAVVANNFEGSSLVAMTPEWPHPISSAFEGFKGLMTEPAYAFVDHGSDTITILTEPDGGAPHPQSNE
ncbi:hypothetical protein [Erythrobacter sp.]|uniref:hypothetical protein n=1 Tax=Erythrobacter sp. TaxID=1042 RepID=UPI003C78AE7F